MLQEDPFGIKVAYNPRRKDRPDNFSGEKICPFCEFEERERLLWEDEKAFIVWNKYPPTKYAFVLVAKPHMMRESSFSRLFGRMVKAFFENKEKWVGEECHPLIFRNKGPKSGASIEHDHGQVICVDDYPYNSSRIASFLSSLKEKWRITERLYAYPYPTRDYELLYLFRDVKDEEEWGLVGKGVEAIYKAYAELGKRLDSHNVVVVLPKEKEFQPFALLLPRPSPIAGIEWLTRVSAYSVKPEEAAAHIRAVLEGEHAL